MDMTDESWKADLSPILNAKFMTANYDAREALMDTAASMTAAGIRLRSLSRKRKNRMAIFQPHSSRENTTSKSDHESAPGIYVYDFGQKSFWRGARSLARRRRD